MELLGLGVHMGHAPCTTLALCPGVAGFVHAVGILLQRLLDLEAVLHRQHCQLSQQCAVCHHGGRG